MAMTSAMLLAVLAGASAATWTVCLKLGASRIHAALGGMIVAGIACVVNTLVMFTLRARGHAIGFQAEGFWLLVVAGAAAAGVDVFALLAYERGLRVTSSLLIGGTSTGLAVLVGFFILREPVTPIKALALALIVAGIVLLQLDGR
jgi:small multidrug resistance pump